MERLLLSGWWLFGSGLLFVRIVVLMGSVDSEIAVQLTRDLSRVVDVSSFFFAFFTFQSREYTGHPSVPFLTLNFVQELKSIA